MSFFFETITIPFWFIVFIFISAAPLWFKWYKRLPKKIIITGLLKKFFNKNESEPELRNDVLKKATDPLNENTSVVADGKEIKRKGYTSETDKIKKQNVRDVLTALAEAGEAGILPRTISDITKVNTGDITSAIDYLASKNYAEVINSTNGIKYYLTDLGRKYCINKRYIS